MQVANVDQHGVAPLITERLGEVGKSKGNPIILKFGMPQAYLGQRVVVETIPACCVPFRLLQGLDQAAPHLSVAAAFSLGAGEYSLISPNASFFEVPQNWLSEQCPWLVSITGSVELLVGSNDTTGRPDFTWKSGLQVLSWLRPALCEPPTV